MSPDAPATGAVAGGAPGWPSLVAGHLDEVARAGRWRAPRTFDARGPQGGLGDGAPGAGGERPVVSFASNDYLGLSTHRAVVAAAHQALDRWGSGAGASRLVTGSRPVHEALERALAETASTAAAVVFPTGFAANLGVLSTLAAVGGPGTLICSDELNHASIIDGCRLARARTEVYRHGDVDQVGALLAAHGRGPAVVVTDSVFSMDGDTAPVEGLVEVCARNGAVLVLDEAHAVLGPEPDVAALGETGVVRVGTLSKTLGSLGGFVAASSAWCQALVNLARPYIFSTALPPADAAAALAALEVVGSPEGAALKRRLAGLVQRVAPGHTTPIVPMVLGSEERAVAASATLLARGLWVPAIRPPTVAPGTSRLRVTLSAGHSDDQVESLVAGLAGIGAGPGAVPGGAAARLAAGVG